MTARKPAPKTKGKTAQPKRAPTKAELQRFTEAANAAAQAALAPLQATMEKLSKQITARHSRALKDLAAAIRAQAEGQGEYALVLPSPSHALVARNAEHAAQKYPEPHTWTPKPYLSQTSLEDEPQDTREYFAEITEALSVPARVLLSLIGGRWADGTHSPACVLDKGSHATNGSCKHAERGVPYTLNALARDLYNSAGGKQGAQIQTLLEELQSTQITYGITSTEAGVPEESALDRTAARLTEPLLQAGQFGVAIGKGKSRTRGNLQRHLILAKGLHEEYRQGAYRRVRRALLVGWTGWQQELALRLYSHIGTYYGSRRLKHHSEDGRSAPIRVGKTSTNPMDLGALADLLPSHADNPAALQRKLEGFAAEVNSRSEPTELHIVGITPIRKGRHTSGWTLDITYPAPPLTGKQQRRLQAAEGRRILAEVVGAAQLAEGRRAAQGAVAAPAAIEKPLRVVLLPDGSEVVVLPPAAPKPESETPATCSHGEPFTLQPAGISKAGKPYAAFWVARHKYPNGKWCGERRAGTP